jgi:hypothetical protein
MSDLSGFPYFPVEFNKEGILHDATQIAALKTHLAEGATTDLVVISHGWNNDMAEAEGLYKRFFTSACEVLHSTNIPGWGDRKLSVLGVLWPSKKFADKELIPSGAAGAASTVELEDLRDKLKSLYGVFDAPDADQKLQAMEALLPKLEDSDRACREFFDNLRALVPAGARDETDGSIEFFALPANELLERLKQPISFTAVKVPDAGGAAAIGDDTAGAAGLGSFFSGLTSGVRNALNYTTYYQMKARAGLVGSKGVNPMLASIKSQYPALRIHLVGHSFGGRLVTATAAGIDDEAVLKIGSLSLLQAAFSHYGFAKKWDGEHDGAFRRVVTRQSIAGPIIATCTANDKAVGIAYPIASLIGGQVASALGDENDIYGGIGCNGAQKTPEALNAVLLDVGQPYAIEAGTIHNLRADAYVKDHGDVTNRQVAYAVLNAIAKT